MASDPYIKQAFQFPGIGVPDVDGLEQLSVKEFSEWYFKLNSDLFQHPKLPGCWNCDKPIPRVEELRRLYGRNLHAPCFKKEFDEAKAKDKMGPAEMRYFSLVERIESV